MAREYQKNKNNPYLLPHNLYMRVLYIVRDYDRIKAIQSTSASKEVSAVKKALSKLPADIGQAVMKNISEDGGDAEINLRLKRRFIYDVAKNLHLI